jgi:hypothetical protein
MCDGARLAKEVEGAFALSAVLVDHREEVDALGLAGEVAIEIEAEGFGLVDPSVEEHVEDVIGAVVELVDAARADFVLAGG